MTMMTKEEARLFKERWKVVNEFTDAEQRRKSASEKVRELESLYQFGREMGWTRRSGDEEKVWARWNRLREIAGVF
jgi:hypothetical protein